MPSLHRMFPRRILLSMKRVFFLLLFLFIMLLLPNMTKRLTYGFRVAKLRLDFPYRPEWEVPPDPSFHEILQQRYTFLGKGTQSYVFGSEDGKYVIKLFRFDYSRTEEKVPILFNACKLSYDFLKKETGLLYIHLNLTPQGLPILHCKDAVGRSYAFDLNQTRFALQKRAQDFRTTLKLAYQNPPEMQKRIDEFINLLQSRTAKEVLNTDSNLSRNFGFLEEEAIEFDFGNYRHIAGLEQKKEIHRYANRMRNWLKKNAPEWLVYFDGKIKEIG